MQNANPYESPKARVADATESGEDIQRVASGQKLIIYAILLNLVTIAIAFVLPVPIIAILLNLASLVMSIIGIVRLGRGLGMAVVSRVLLVLLMFVPLINVITLLVINSRATRRLRDAGYTVGLMGARI